ncbi:hypothetical protein KGF54_000628 [Candida jiufengensis]|uniref:uncharacterized protein n=1 Tax=Candida jiufengensis TaxID=497108 RepID=UPI002224C215|nr:uncharacterized protein KGF54_000628 [Candida jiufengensis]KAI5957009.1 hypothetical protein KGF54_000628 [Candida jiufengensis]
MATKYALITGASSGIGYDLSIELSKKGYKVIGCSPQQFLVDQKPLEEKYGVISLPLDITNKEQINKCFEKVNEITNGKLSILYNNAGIAIIGPAIDIDEDKLDKLFQVNVIGHINVTKKFAPLVIADRGTIVFTSSVAARVPLSWISAYNSTKAAIDAYALTLHGEMKPFGVRVHSVITGGVDTKINENGSFEQIDSFYNVPGFLESVLTASSMTKTDSVSPQAYAKKVVKDLTRYRDPGFNLYHGKKAYLLHWISRYLPLWLTEFFIQAHFRQLKVLKYIATLANKGKFAKTNDKNFVVKVYKPGDTVEK